MRSTASSAAVKSNSANCAWCGAGGRATSKDHVFPRVLGGTKELSLPACSRCQTDISKFEQEIGRSSPYSMFLIEKGPKRSDKRKSSSGFLRTRYCLAKHPAGGYAEACVRVGDPTPRALPHIEIDVSGSWQMRRRAPNPQEMDRFIQILLTMIERQSDPGELASQLFARTENIAAISEDSDFWPRVVLDVSGRPFIRARSKDEALRFTELLVAAFKIAPLRDYTNWRDFEITGGTEHVIQLRCRESSLHRLAAKVTFGLVWLSSVELREDPDALLQLRQFVLGRQARQETIRVRWILKPNAITVFPEHNLAIVSISEGRVDAAVSFCGDCSIVELPFEADGPVRGCTIVAASRRDGTKTEIVTDPARASQVLDVFRNAGSLVVSLDDPS
jgi:hypothetical protein